MRLLENTTWNRLDTIVDCRALTLAFEFYELNSENVSSLKEDVLDWIHNSILPEMKSAWALNGRTAGSIQQVKRNIQEAIGDKTGMNASFEAYLSNKEIVSPAVIRRYRKRLVRMVFPCGQPEPTVSRDFPHYWNSLFPFEMDAIRKENAQIKKQILSLFKEKGRIYTTACFSPDADGAFWMHPYQNLPDRFYGSFYLNINAFCLGTKLDEAAELFLKQLEKLGTQYPQMNGRVMLQPPTATPGRSPYMNYFGMHRNSDGSHHDANQTPEEWYTTYYLCGVEWANLISPRTQQHFPSVADMAFERQTVACRMLEGGGLMLKSRKGIQTFEAEDASCMKQMVQDGLYPGGREFVLREYMHYGTLPRHNWAIVPVEEDEVTVLGTTLVFRSRNYN